MPDRQTFDTPQTPVNEVVEQTLVEHDVPADSTFVLGEQANRQTDLLPDTIINGRYKVICHIAKGGYGSVYKVEHMAMRKLWALKTLNAIAATDAIVRRFQIEARAAGTLEHANLVRAFDFGLIDEKQPFLVMELLEGETLAHYLRRNGHLKLSMIYSI